MQGEFQAKTTAAFGRDVNHLAAIGLHGQSAARSRPRRMTWMDFGFDSVMGERYTTGSGPSTWLTSSPVPK